VTTSRDLVEIGHAIIHCPRCGVPRHVPVAAACRPIATDKTKTFRTYLNGEEIGQIYIEVKNLPDGHRCGPKPGKPEPGNLKAVRAAVSA